MSTKSSLSRNGTAANSAKAAASIRRRLLGSSGVSAVGGEHSGSAEYLASRASVKACKGARRRRRHEDGERFHA